MGKYREHRDTYFCSELVTSACCAAGLLDPARTRPSATYPHDLFYDHSYNLFNALYLRLADCWEPPARWTSCPVPEAGVGAPAPQDEWRGETYPVLSTQCRVCRAAAPVVVYWVSFRHSVLRTRYWVLRTGSSLAPRPPSPYNSPHTRSLWTGVTSPGGLLPS